MHRAWVSVVASFLVIASVGANTKKMKVFSFTQIPPGDDEAACFLDCHVEPKNGALYGNMTLGTDIEGVLAGIVVGLIEPSDPAAAEKNLCNNLDKKGDPFSWLINRFGQKTCPVKKGAVIKFNAVQPDVAADVMGPFAMIMTVALLDPEHINADFNDLAALVAEARDICQYIVAGTV